MKDTRILSLAIALTVLVAAGQAAAQASAPPTQDLNPAVLEVNGEKIYAAQISMVMSNIQAQLSGQGEQPDNQQLVSMATQRVVEQKLLAQEAQREGIQADELRVAEMMKQLEQQSGGRAGLESTLATRGSSIEQIEELVREMDLSRSYIATKIMPTVSVSDEELTAFYEENPETFRVPERVHARHIICAATADADEADAAAARAKAEAARERAIAGEDFAELAREISEGPTAERGGDLGFFPHSMMEPAFADAAFALEPGQISEVVRSNYGFHVIKVEEKRPAGIAPLDEVKEQARMAMEQRKAGAAVEEKLKALSESAEVKPLLQQPQVAAPGQ
jgi:peptidyl-prolyl cis-trans isomerase C